MRSDLNGQLDLMLDEDAVEYKPKRECLKTGLVKKIGSRQCTKKGHSGKNAVQGEKVG